MGTYKIPFSIRIEMKSPHKIDYSLFLSLGQPHELSYSQNGPSIQAACTSRKKTFRVVLDLVSSTIKDFTSRQKKDPKVVIFVKSIHFSKYRSSPGVAGFFYIVIKVLSNISKLVKSTLLFHVKFCFLSWTLI